jgi:hypothetical protein
MVLAVPEALAFVLVTIALLAPISWLWHCVIDYNEQRRTLSIMTLPNRPASGYQQPIGHSINLEPLQSFGKLESKHFLGHCCSGFHKRVRNHWMQDEFKKSPTGMFV